MRLPPSVASSRVTGRAQSWQSAWSVAVRLPWATSGNTSSSLQAGAGTGFWGACSPKAGKQGAPLTALGDVL